MCWLRIISSTSLLIIVRYIYTDANLSTFVTFVFFFYFFTRSYTHAHTLTDDAGNRSVLWRLELRGSVPRWDVDIMAGNPVPYAGRELYKGTFTVTYGEASAAYDSVKKKAYVFGGWHDEFMW